MYTYNTDQILKDSQFKYYLLGLIASDGYISDRYNRIELTLNSKDKHILESIRDVVCPGKKISFKEKHNASRLILDNKIIHEEICKYIKPGNKTYSLIFPYGIPDKYLKDFVRGYIDGDGNISVKKGQRKFGKQIKYYFGLRLRALGTKAFLNGLSDNLFRLGICKNRVNPHRKDKENVFYCEWGFKQAENVLNWIYQDSVYKLDRKYKVFLEISNKDSDQLAKNYGTETGCYNMQAATSVAKV